MRESDLICRYGGEEFCFLLPESDCQGLCAAAERVFWKRFAPLSERGYSGAYHRVDRGDHAFGCHTSLEDLIQQADQALYRAKQAGRNRVEIQPKA